MPEFIHLHLTCSLPSLPRACWPAAGPAGQFCGPVCKIAGQPLKLRQPGQLLGQPGQLLAWLAVSHLNLSNLVSWLMSSQIDGLPKYGQSTFPLSKSSLPRCNEYSICILRWKNSSYLMMLLRVSVVYFPLTSSQSSSKSPVLRYHNFDLNYGRICTTIMYTFTTYMIALRNTCIQLCK